VQAELVAASLKKLKIKNAVSSVDMQVCVTWNEMGKRSFMVKMWRETLVVCRY
jgi:hypothetical protein